MWQYDVDIYQKNYEIGTVLSFYFLDLSPGYFMSYRQSLNVLLLSLANGVVLAWVI